MKSQSHQSELDIRRKPVGPHGVARGGRVDGEGGAQTYRPGASSVSSRPPVGVCRSGDDGGQGRSNPLSQHSNNWTERAAIRLDLRRARPGRTLRRHVPSTPDCEACGRISRTCPVSVGWFSVRRREWVNGSSKIPRRVAFSRARCPESDSCANVMRPTETVVPRSFILR